MLITSVERHKKNKDKLSVYIDNQYAFSILEEDYIRLGFYEKQEIAQDEIDHIKTDINYRSAKSMAVKFLVMKLRSERDVREKLDNEGYDDEVISNVIEELKSMGYINDRMYAQKYVYDRSKLKPQSKKLLKYDLINRGIPEEITDEVLTDWEIDETAVAESLIRRKFGKYDFNDLKVQKKIYSFLQHRGFSFQQIDEALKSFQNQ